MQHAARYQPNNWGGGQPPQQPPNQQPPPGGGGNWGNPPPDQYPPPDGNWGTPPPERNWMLIGGVIAGIMSCLFVIIIGIIFLVAFGGDDDDETDTSVPSANLGAPTVTIISPTSGQVFDTGTTITVQAQVSDPGVGIGRVQLLVNNEQVDSQVSQNPNGDQAMSVLLDYDNTLVPNESLVLVVRAIRVGETQGYDASVRVAVRDAAQPTATPQPGNTQAPAPTQAPFDPTCRARVDVQSLNVRLGPSTDFDILGIVGIGDEPRVIGRLGDNSWWQINSNNAQGWVNAPYTTLIGSNANCAAVPITTPPASPTPAASPTPQGPSDANLVISTLSGANNIIFTGGEVSATYILRVQNVGGTAAGAFNVTITYPDGNITDFTVQSLAPGEEVDIPSVTARYSAPGSYRLSVLVDSSGNITESNKQDNTGFLDISVDQPTPTPEGG